MKKKIGKKIQIVVGRNIQWIVLFICVIIFLSIAEEILENQIWKFDDQVYRFIAKFITPGVTIFFKGITNLGGVIAVISITIGLFIFNKNKKYGIYTVLNLFIITIMNQVMKFIVQRPRPTQYRIIDERGYSFPSGHTMVNMAFYGFLIYLIYTKIENNHVKWTLCTILTWLIPLIGISRIYLGVHYASDVIAGATISMAYLILFTHIVGRQLKKERKEIK